MLILTACSSSETATELLDKSLLAHGGLEYYQDLSRLSYNKTTILYDSAGEVESRVTQLHAYYFGSVVSGSILWNIDSVAYRVEFSGNDVKKYVNDSLVDDPSIRGLVTSSQFVLFQPFKLTDPGTQLSLVEKSWLQSDEIYPVLMPTYEGGSSDQWWFYIGEDNRVTANLVRHNDRYSFIENLAYTEDQPLLLHAHRKSYFTDSLLEKKLLRAEYFYEGYLVE